jgi:serine/threonine-protein kinase
MGAVWRAEDLNLGAEVAVKLIDESFANSSEALARFRREARAAAAIRSTYVVQVLDYGVDNGTPFIAMELLKGESLANRLESVGKLTAEQTGHLLGHVGRALELAHQNGIVHRDMKPGNIFLVREGNEDIGKVLDFGIARQSGGLDESGGLKTQTGNILGTPFYMSAEQASGQAADYKSDIWSYGVIAFECLVGRKAFHAENLGGLFHAICMAPLPIPSQFASVPPQFDAWFARAVARDPSQRFPSIAQAAEDLRMVCGRTSTQPSIESAAEECAHTDDVPAARTVTVSFSALASSVAPSSQTIPKLPKKRAALPWIAVGGVLLIGTGVALGWRSVKATRPTVASGPTIISSTESVSVQRPLPAKKLEEIAATTARAEVPSAAPSASSVVATPHLFPKQPRRKAAQGVASTPSNVADEVTTRVRNASGL